MNVATPSAAATKWNTRASAAASTYTQNVAASTVDWSGLTAASQPTWAAAVQTAAANNYFQDGVTRVGTAAWKTGVATKGAARYPQGVAAGQTKYQTNVTPYIQALQGLTLPARNVKGSNIGRVTAIDDLMMATKQQIG